MGRGAPQLTGCRASERRGGFNGGAVTRSPAPAGLEEEIGWGIGWIKGRGSRVVSSALAQHGVMEVHLGLFVARALDVVGFGINVGKGGAVFIVSIV